MDSRSLLFPSWVTMRRNLEKRGPKVVGSLVVGALIVGLLLYYGLFRFLVYVGKAPMLGAIIGPMIGGLLVAKLLEMILVALFFMIIFSSIVAAFSVFYLDDEIHLLMASPVAITRVFWSRFLMMVMESSWMAVAFFIPIFYSFATALQAPGWAYFFYPVILGLFLLLPNLIGSLTALTLASLFPIRQMKKVFQFLSVIVLSAMVIFFRFLEPEKLLNPNYFTDVSKYILNLQSPMMEYSPSTWAQQASMELFRGDLSACLTTLLPLLFLVGTGLIVMHVLSKGYYRPSWQASLEAVENQVLGLEWVRRALILPFRLFPPDFQVIAEKEVTVFLRDPAIFSQVFMMAAILFVYGYNLTILPLKDLPSLYSGEINDSLVFFNGPFIGFILSAIAMRFVYPSISLEGRAFWAVKASPIRISRLLQVKFFLYLTPMMALGLILCFISNSIFKVTYPILFWLSFLNVILMTLVITALAVGLGAIHAQFNSDNPLKIAGSFGGFVFMILCALYVVNLLALEAYPMFRFYFWRFYPFMATKGYVMIGLSFFLLFLCSCAWIFIPLIQGREAIERYEPD